MTFRFTGAKPASEAPSVERPVQMAYSLRAQHSVDRCRVLEFLRDIGLQDNHIGALKAAFVVLAPDGPGEIVLRPHFGLGNLQGFTTRMLFVHGDLPRGLPMLEWRPGCRFRL